MKCLINGFVEEVNMQSVDYVNNLAFNEMRDNTLLAVPNSMQ